MVEVQPEGLLEYIIIQHRWVVVLLALLPMSGLWKLWSVLRNYVVFKMSSAPKLHDKKVKDVQNQVKQWLAGDRSSHMCTARPTWQTMSFRQGIYKNTFTNIRVNLVDILEVDTKKMVDLFTMHGPAWRESVVTFEMRMVDVQASHGVKPLDLRCFDMRPSNNICVVSLVCAPAGPQVAELELSMALYQRDQFAGSAVARLIVIVSEYDF